MADYLRPSIGFPPQQKRNIGAPLIIGRSIQPTGQPPDPLPVGQRWDWSAPPRKVQVRFNEYPNMLAIGIPVPQEYPAFLATAGIGERRWPPGVDVYPNLLATTFLVAPGPLPIGKQLLTIAPPRKFQVQVDKLRTDLVRGIPQVVPPSLPLGLPVDINVFKRKYSVTDLNMLWPNSQLPRTIPPPVNIVSTYVGGTGGGGGTGLGKQTRNKGAEKCVDLAELEVMIRALTSEKASDRMVYETDLILAQYSEHAHPEVEDVYLKVLAQDCDAVEAIKALYKRYSDKRNEMFNNLRKSDYEWDE